MIPETQSGFPDEPLDGVPYVKPLAVGGEAD